MTWYRKNTVQTLTIVPANDGNFKIALEDATKEQLEEALERMRGTERNKARIMACERELRKRNKRKENRRRGK